VTPFYPEPIIPVPHDTAPMCSEAARLGRPLNPGDPTKQIVRDKQHELHARLAAFTSTAAGVNLPRYSYFQGR